MPRPALCNPTTALSAGAQGRGRESSGSVKFAPVPGTQQYERLLVSAFHRPASRCSPVDANIQHIFHGAG